MNPQLSENERQGVKSQNQYSEWQREVFSRLYSPNLQEVEEVGEGLEWARKLHDCVGKLPEFKALQEQTKGNELWAGIGTAALAKAVASELSKTPRGSKANIEEMKERLDSLHDLQNRGVDTSERIKKLNAKIKRTVNRQKKVAEGMDMQALEVAISKACDSAQEKIEENSQLVDSFSFDGRGTPHLMSNLKSKRELAQKLRNRPKLKRIADLAGRLRRIAAEKQRSKSDTARHEVCDIEQGADLGRLLPTELSALCGDNEVRKLLFYSAYAERKCLQYQLSGKEKEGKGPIIICMDESGSMVGSPEEYSKAVAMALLDVAKKQKRDWAFVHFCSYVSRVDIVKSNKATDPQHLMDCMQHFTGGGTNFMRPLERCLRIIDEEGGFKKADIVLITDGACHTGEHWNQTFSEDLKRREASLYTVLINGAKSCKSVEAWSTEVFDFNSTEQEGCDEAFGALSSVV